MRQGAIALAVAAAVVALLASKEPVSSQPSAEAKILRVAEAGKAAVLKNRPADLCRLLTPRARRNSRKSFLYREYARRRHPPRTCVSGAGFEIRGFRREAGFKRVQRNPALASFRVARITGNRARVELSVYAPDGYGPGADIWFVNTKAGWRADMASFSPWDGSSGL